MDPIDGGEWVARAGEVSENMPSPMKWCVNAVLCFWAGTFYEH